MSFARCSHPSSGPAPYGPVNPKIQLNSPKLNQVCKLASMFLAIDSSGYRGDNDDGSREYDQRFGLQIGAGPSLLLL
jgi:hypothetical protein